MNTLAGVQSRSCALALAWLLPLSAAIGQTGAPTPAPEAAAGQSGTIVTTAVVKPAAGGAKAPGQISTADDLLTALETADKDLRSLVANIVHLKRESELIGNRTQEHRGRLLFQSIPGQADAAAPPRRLFQIDFTDLIVDGTLRKESKSWIFDGRWLIEKQPSEKQIFKREIAAPGTTTDPLALGEGRFPIPIGQRKDRILERFDATLLPPEQGFPAPPGGAGDKGDSDKAGALPEWVADSHQLLLVPKRGTAIARDYAEVRIWYRKGDLLPRMARTLNTDDSTDDVILSRVVKNGELPPGAFDTTIPPGWDVEISEFRGQEAAGGEDGSGR